MNSKVPYVDASERVFPAESNSVVAGQATVLVTGQAVPLSLQDATHDLVTKITVKAIAPVSGQAVMIGGPGVTTAVDGTGTGYPIANGQEITLAVQNAGLVYINGQAGSAVAYYGS